MIVPTTPEQMAKALLPGLKAITMSSIENAILQHAKEYVSNWVRQSFKSADVTATTDPDGKLVFLVKVDLEDLTAGHRNRA